MIAENASLEEIREAFKNDRFATKAAHCALIDAHRGYARCEMILCDIHRNAMENIMGGAIFTLADYALAIASNVGEQPSVSVDHAISFFRSSKGAKLIAEANCVKPGSHLAFYEVEVTDDLGKSIARMSATCYRV